jgi:alkylhydroperoxidase family enzyme
VTVGPFTAQEAAAYLTAVLAAHDRNEPDEQINGLATDLGHLPLALAQAAAYLVDADLTCASYRELLADRIRKLADLLPESGALPDDQTATVGTSSQSCPACARAASDAPKGPGRLSRPGPFGVRLRVVAGRSRRRHGRLPGSVS